MGTIVRSALVAYSASEMYALVENIEAYPDFLPWCRATQVVERGEGATIARLSVGLKGINQSFTTSNTNIPGEAIELRLLEGPFRAFHAEWKFTALQAHAARIAFSMTYEFSGGMLAKVLNPLFDHIADTMVDAFTRRALSVYGPPES